MNRGLPLSGGSRTATVLCGGGGEGGDAVDFCAWPLPTRHLSHINPRRVVLLACCCSREQKAAVSIGMAALLRLRLRLCATVMQFTHQSREIQAIGFGSLGG